MVSKIPNPLDRFLIQAKRNESIPELIAQFQRQNPKVDIANSYFRNNFTYQAHRGYNYRDMMLRDFSFFDRQIDLVLHPFERYYDKRPVFDLLCLLSKTNKSLIFLGDSLSGQTYEAFQVEEFRESIQFRRLSQQEIISLHSFCGTTSAHKFNRKILALQWIPPKNVGLSNNVNIMFLWLASYEHETKMCSYQDNVDSTNICYNTFGYSLLGVLPCFNSRYFTGGMYIVVNQGAHIKGNKTESYYQIFKYLHQLSVVNPKTIIAYRETFPIFYDKRGYGYFQNREIHTYPCIQLNSKMKSIYHEYTILSQIQEYDNIGFNINFIFSYRYFLPFWKQRPGYLRYLNSSDCVHSIVLLPTTWMPLFYDIWNVYSRTINNISSCM